MKNIQKLLPWQQAVCPTLNRKKKKLSKRYSANKKLYTYQELPAAILAMGLQVRPTAAATGTSAEMPNSSITFFATALLAEVIELPSKN